MVPARHLDRVVRVRDHTDAAAERMRWLRQLAAETQRPGTGHRSTAAGGDMNQTCDRCGPAVRAACRVRRAGELYLCRHCLNRLWPALSAQGWALCLLGEHALTAQAAPVTGGRERT